MSRVLLALTIFLCLLPFSQSTVASNNSSLDTGAYTIHYNAIPTASLPPKVASAYGILRSKTRGLLNVAVIRNQEGTTGKPVHAKVTVQAANLAGQIKNIELREITEKQAIYTIGQFGISHSETIVFDIYVTPEGSGETHHIHYQRQFFVEE